MKILAASAPMKLGHKCCNLYFPCKLFPSFCTLLSTILLLNCEINTQNFLLDKVGGKTLKMRKLGLSNALHLKGNNKFHLKKRNYYYGLQSVRMVFIIVIGKKKSKTLKKFLLLLFFLCRPNKVV